MTKFVRLILCLLFVSISFTAKADGDLPRKPGGFRWDMSPSEFVNQCQIYEGNLRTIDTSKMNFSRGIVCENYHYEKIAKGYPITVAYWLPSGNIGRFIYASAKYSSRDDERWIAHLNNTSTILETTFGKPTVYKRNLNTAVIVKTSWRLSTGSIHHSINVILNQVYDAIFFDTLECSGCAE